MISKFPSHDEYARTRTSHAYICTCVCVCACAECDVLFEVIIYESGMEEPMRTLKFGGLNVECTYVLESFCISGVHCIVFMKKW